MQNDSTQIKPDYDILIIGAGMVGASLACALRGQPLRVGLIEAVAFNADRPQSGYDARTTALSYGTKRIFEGMQLWELLSGQVTAIKKIHVSDHGHFGFTRLDCAEQGLDALGYVVENAALGRLLADVLSMQSNVELICPARVEDIAIDAGLAHVSINVGDDKKRTATAHLVVLADGRKSAVRERLGIQSSDRDCAQSAIIANITPEYPHANIAYERFTKNGPLALLPMSENRCAVVWTLRNDELDSVMSLDDADFLGALQHKFGWRLGRLLQAGKRHTYPLALTRTHELVRARLALIGNAAHTVHPIAGQGFNLGLRDVAVLAQVLVDAVSAGRDIGELTVLHDYLEWRQRDHRLVTTLTDSLVRVFSSDFAPLIAARNLGLIALDSLPFLSKVFVRQGMGLLGRQPRLARGLPL
ncbi:MAG: 2-octaprenyl-6-methoxyphenyl hydroxylase [Gammaproteobacteria bacterium]